MERYISRGVTVYKYIPPLLSSLPSLISSTEEYNGDGEYNWDGEYKCR